MASNISPLAESLNSVLSSDGCRVLDLLSERGKAIYFPSKGILGQSAEAAGKEINATIGTAFEEDGSPLTLECIEDTMTLPSTSFLYAPSFGNPGLRGEWGKLLSIKNPSLAGKSYSNPVVTAALTHALSMAGYLFMEEGDELILPDMNWDNYDLVFGEAYGVKLKTHNTFKNGGFDVAALEATLNEGEVGKKVVLLNFPNNPTGYTVSNEEAKALAEVFRKAAEAGNQLVILLDDAYFGLVYEEGVFKESLFALLADLHEDVLAVKLDGPTKEDYVWGFRVGFMTFGYKGATAEQYKALEAKAAGAVRGNISNAPSISQAILLKGYTHESYAAQKQEKYDILKARYDKIIEILTANPQYSESFEAMPFNSGYFMCVKPVVDAEAVRVELLEKFSTGVINLSGLIRLAFSAVPLDKLEQLFANLHSAIQNVKNA